MSKQKKKPLILLLSDDMRLHSGIATMSKEIVLHTSHKYDWIQVGAAVKHPDEGKFFDVSDSVNEEAGIDNASVKIIPSSGYGNQQLIRNLMVIRTARCNHTLYRPTFLGLVVCYGR